ncbi:MAG: hypothetical protein IPP43_03545 [Chitinophagaceae bacterium]|nr:hypothetical protein [Chitinophagaceae bacterium]
MAIWDKEKLFIIRDRFGVKPLVYYKENDFAFASELKNPAEFTGRKENKYPGLAGLFFPGIYSNAHCILENFHKLPNGHYLTVERGNVQVKPYYQFEEKIAARPLPVRKEEEVLDEFEALLASSKIQQISDVPIGAF